MDNDTSFADSLQVDYRTLARMSIDPTSAVLPGEHQAGAIVTSTIGNTARNNAIQINGSIAGKIYNLNFQNLVINCSCNAAASIVSHERAADWPIQCPSLSITASKSARRLETKPSTASRSSGTSKHATFSNQNLALYSNFSKKLHLIRANFRTDISYNLIAHRIVKRLCVQPKKGGLSLEPILLGHEWVAPTGDFVDLACFAKDRDSGIAHRFYVVRDCSSFDVLFANR